MRFILADWMQKVSDRKPIPLLPGNNDPSFCIFTAMGDAALVGAFNVVSLSSTATQHFMFPSLLKGTTPDVVLTTLLRSLAARVEGADPGMSSHSMRHGIVSEAMAAGFTPTAVAWFSGHAPDMSPVGLLSYLVRTAKAAMPVAAFTAGWPEHGSVYKFTPEPPNLDALGSLPHNESLDLVADKLFDISNLRTPWLAMSKLDYSRALGPGGTTAPQMTHLRCLVRTWLASQIMYYPRRLNRYGTRFLPVSKLTDTVAQVLSVNKASAANVITQWADALHKQFITANQMCLIDASLLPTLQKYTEVAMGGQAAISQLATTVAAVAKQQVVLAEMQLKQLELLQKMDARAEAEAAARGAAAAGPSVSAPTSFDTATVMAGFVETSAAAASAAAGAASATAALRALGGIQLPRSRFPHDERRRVPAGGGGGGGGGGGAPPLHAAPPLLRAAPPLLSAPPAALPPPLAAALPPPPPPAAAPPPLPPPTQQPSATRRDAPPPPPGSAPLAAPTPPSAPLLPPPPPPTGGQVVAATLLAGRPFPPVPIDTSASLADTYFELLRCAVPKKVPRTRTFDHTMTEGDRVAMLRDNSKPDGVLSKQKWGKVKNALAAMDAMTTKKDRATLWAVWGTALAQEDVAALQDEARGVTTKLAALAKKRVEFTALKGGATLPAWKTAFTSNTFAERADMLAQSVATKSSWAEAPPIDFWQSLRGEYSAHVAQVLAEMPGGGAAGGGGGGSTASGAAGGAASGAAGGAPLAAPPSDALRAGQKRRADTTLYAAGRVAAGQAAADAAADAASRLPASAQSSMPQPPAPAPAATTSRWGFFF